MIETKKIIQTITYILNKAKRTLDKIVLVKLTYLADKYHLLKYGRTITNDIYLAMPKGPVGSTVLNVLNFDNFNLSEDEYKYAKTLLAEKNKNSFIAQKKNSEYDMLSESDKEALDFIIDKFSKIDKWKLVAFTHKYPEWKNHEQLFNKGQSKREPIDIEELLSIIPGDNFNFSKAHIKQTREIIRLRKC